MATEKASKLSCTSATARLKQDYIRLIKDPVPYVAAAPLPSNMLEWHYVVTGPEATPYEGGLYHGKLVFPRQFPFKPPSIYMITPNGRFKTNTRLCLSISDFHPDTWNPAWTVSSILTGLISFMVESTPTSGSIESTTQAKRAFAQQSLEFNLRNETFRSLFPETASYVSEQLGKNGAKEEGSGEKRDEAVSGKSLPIVQRGEGDGRENVNDGESDVKNDDAGEDNNNNIDNGDASEVRRVEPVAAGFAGGQVINICVFLGVAAFAITVKCVLASTR